MKSMCRLSRIAAAGVLIAVMSAALSAENDSAKNSKAFNQKDLSALVSAAFQKAYPHAKITGANKEVKDGKTFYEIESIDGKVERNLLYTPDGVIYEIEEGIETGKLPALVKTCAQTEYPKGKIEKSEKIMRGETVEFELLIASGDKRIELVVDASGKIVRSTVVANGDDDKEDKQDD